MKIFALLALIMIPVASTHARVVGQLGSVYPIKEKSFLQVIEERKRSVNAKSIQKKMQDTINELLPEYSLPDSVKNIPPATENKAYKVDLSYTLPYDIKGIDGEIIYPKGYTFNPLKILAKQKIYYPSVLVIFNADRKEELEYIKQNFAGKINTKLIITNGHAYKLTKDFKKPVYNLTARLRDRLVIQETPSLVYQPKGSVFLQVQTIYIGEEKNENNK